MTRAHPVGGLVLAFILAAVLPWQVADGLTLQRFGLPDRDDHEGLRRASDVHPTQDQGVQHNTGGEHEVQRISHGQAHDQPHVQPVGPHGRSEHEHIDDVSIAIGSCLLGSVTMVMAMFYLVNWPDADIRANAWQTLSMTISIFASVLIFGTLVRIIVSTFSIESQEGQTLVLLGVFSACFLFLQIVLYFLIPSAEHMQEARSQATATHTHTSMSARKLSVHATSTLLSHITGFAAMYGCADVQAIPAVASSLWRTIGVSLAAAAVLTGLNSIGAHIRTQVALAGDGEISEEEEEWFELVEECENDIYGLCIGFCTMQVLRFAITGSPHPYHAPYGPDSSISQFDANMLLLTSLLLPVFIGIGAKTMTMLDSERVTLRRALRASISVLSVATAWCILFWFEWQLYVLGFDGLRMVGLLMVALGLTVLSCMLIISLDFLADRVSKDGRRALRALMLSMGLMVGFAWERSFDMGLEAVTEGAEEQLPWLQYTYVAMFMVAVVLPAWAKYILPKELHARHMTECSYQKSEA